MTIAVDASKIDEIDQRLAVLENGFDCFVEDGFVGFIEPLKENENASDDTGRKGGIPQEASAQYNDNLRCETAEMVARKIRERLKESSTKNRADQGKEEIIG